MGSSWALSIGPLIAVCCQAPSFELFASRADSTGPSELVGSDCGNAASTDRFISLLPESESRRVNAIAGVMVLSEVANAS
jgi:hypothetical protein